MVIDDRQMIAKNINYNLLISQSKNRAYLTLKGYWDEFAQLDDYMDDIKKATKLLSKGFMYLVDLSDFSGCVSKFLKLNIEVQKYIVSQGLSRTAEVLPANPILRAVAESMSKESGMYAMYFKDRASAEKWLEIS